jgi:hypothetical protein
MRRVTLRLESLDDRVVPSTVSGDVVATHRGDYLMASASGAGGDIIRGVYSNGDDVGHVDGLGSKAGGTGEGVTPFGGRVITGDI